MTGSRVRLTVVMLALIVPGCGRDSVTPVTALPAAPTPAPAPAPSGPTVVVTGQVSDSMGRPLAARVVAYPLRPSAAWAGPWGRGTDADASGRYRLTSAPEHHDTVFVRAWKDGYVQQCATAITLAADASADLTLTPRDQVVLTGLPNPPNGRTVSGTVYEIRENVRQPAAGIWVGWEPIMDTVVADTFTDAQGRYRICGLSRDRIEVFAVRVAAPARPVSVTVDPGGDAVVDLELP